MAVYVNYSNVCTKHKKPSDINDNHRQTDDFLGKYSLLKTLVIKIHPSKFRLSVEISDDLVCRLTGNDQAGTIEFLLNIRGLS